MKQQIVIFASGKGSNAAAIIDYIQAHQLPIDVLRIITNNPNAGVLDIAQAQHIPTYLLDTSKSTENAACLEMLQALQPDLIILAGYLKKIPASWVAAFPNKIINIHPALLPKYGGKGMYGMRVHEAVMEAGEKQSGITIHYVNEQYDEGAIIHQATCEISMDDTPTSLAQKIHQLEHAHYPRIIASLLEKH